MGQVVLCNISDANQVIKDLRINWVYDALESLGIPPEIRELQDVFELRSVLGGLGIYVEYRSAGEEIDVYKREWHGTEETGSWMPPKEKHLVAQWKRPQYVRKVEGNDVYYELHLDEWCIANRRI
jgi:hypothetical protein